MWVCERDFLRTKRGDTPTSLILSQRSPVPKSLFSMVVDIVQRVGSADWHHIV